MLHPKRKKKEIMLHPDLKKTKERHFNSSDTDRFSEMAKYQKKLREKEKEDKRKDVIKSIAASMFICSASEDPSEIESHIISLKFHLPHNCSTEFLTLFKEIACARKFLDIEAIIKLTNKTLNYLKNS